MRKGDGLTVTLRFRQEKTKHCASILPAVIQKSRGEVPSPKTRRNSKRKPNTAPILPSHGALELPPERTRDNTHTHTHTTHVVKVYQRREGSDQRHSGGGDHKTDQVCTSIPTRGIGSKLQSTQSIKWVYTAAGSTPRAGAKEQASTRVESAITIITAPTV